MEPNGETGPTSGFAEGQDQFAFDSRRDLTSQQLTAKVANIVSDVLRDLMQTAALTGNW
jgi:hypothetical protein